RLTRNGRFVHRSHAVDDFSVAGNEFSGGNGNQVADAQLGAWDFFDLTVAGNALGDGFRTRSPQRFRLRFAATIGPRLSAGKNVSAPRMRITLISSSVNNGVVTGNVPSDGGTYFFCARLPAMASMGTIMKKRPSNMVMPVAVSYQGVLMGPSPPK